MKPLLSLLAGRGDRSRLTTLIFHRVTPDVDPLFPDEVCSARFDTLCGWLRSWFEVLPVPEAVARLQAGELPSRAACITFDDGYADNHDVALPILQRHGLSSAFFVATGFLDGGRMWNDTLIEVIRRAPGPELDLRGVPDVDLGVLPLHDMAARRGAMQRTIMSLKYLAPALRAARVADIEARSGVRLPTDLMMTSEQVRKLHQAGMTIGAHTVNHPILAKLGDDAARAELESSRARLRQITGADVSLFAYPNGKPGEDFCPRDVRLARELGFSAAFTTAPGVAQRGTDRFQLPRFTPWRRERWAFGLQLARNLAAANRAE